MTKTYIVKKVTSKGIPTYEIDLDSYPEFSTLGRKKKNANVKRIKSGNIDKTLSNFLCRPVTAYVI